MGNDKNIELLKVVFIDVETTGRDHKVCGITQISGAIDYIHYNSVNRSFEVENKENFNFLLQPFEKDQIEDEALEITKITREDLSSPLRYLPHIAYLEFYGMLKKHVDPYNKLDKAFFVGFNAGFDADFMRRFFEKNGDKYFDSLFWFPYLDLMTTSCFMNMTKRKSMPNYKLSTVMEKIYNEGIKSEELHDAKYDIDLTRKLFYFNLSELIK